MIVKIEMSSLFGQDKSFAYDPVSDEVLTYKAIDKDQFKEAMKIKKEYIDATKPPIREDNSVGGVIVGIILSVVVALAFWVNTANAATLAPVEKDPTKTYVYVLVVDYEFHPISGPTEYGTDVEDVFTSEETCKVTIYDEIARELVDQEVEVTLKYGDLTFTWFIKGSGTMRGTVDCKTMELK